MQPATPNSYAQVPAAPFPTFRFSSLLEWRLNDPVLRGPCPISFVVADTASIAYACPAEPAPILPRIINVQPTRPSTKQPPTQAPQLQLIQLQDSINHGLTAVASASLPTCIPSSETPVIATSLLPNRQTESRPAAAALHPTTLAQRIAGRPSQSKVSVPPPKVGNEPKINYQVYRPFSNSPNLRPGLDSMRNLSRSRDFKPHSSHPLSQRQIAEPGGKPVIQSKLISTSTESKGPLALQADLGACGTQSKSTTPTVIRSRVASPLKPDQKSPSAGPSSPSTSVQGILGSHVARPAAAKQISACPELGRSNSAKSVYPISQESPLSTSTESLTPGNFDLSNGDTKIALLIKNFTPDFVERKIPIHGLVNNGNMCFINVVLQPLLHCPPFANLIADAAKTGDFASPLHIDSSSTAKCTSLDTCPTPLLNSFAAMAMEIAAVSSPDDILTPDRIFNAVRGSRKGQMMPKGCQEDAEEFLGFLLDSLHLECIRLRKSVGLPNAATGSNSGTTSQIGYQSNSLDSELGMCDNSSNDEGGLWSKVTASGTRSTVTNPISPVTMIFGGVFQSTLRVPGVKKPSENEEPFLTLPLVIHPVQINSVEEALEMFFAPEKIDGYQSSSVDAGNVCAQRQLQLYRIPPILIITLKRFVFDGMVVSKLRKHITVPRKLDLSHYTTRLIGGYPGSSQSVSSPLSSSSSSSGKQQRQYQQQYFAQAGRENSSGGDCPSASEYRLFAIVNHHGRAADGGHYTCDVVAGSDSGWLHFDDTVIQRLREAAVLKERPDCEPYLLFYERVGVVLRNYTSSSTKYDAEHQNNNNNHKGQKSEVNGSLGTSTGSPNNTRQAKPPRGKRRAN